MLDTVFSLRNYVANLLEDGGSSDSVVEALVMRAASDAALRDALILLGAKQAVRIYYSDARNEAYPIRGARLEAVRDTKETKGKRVSKEEREERMEAKENRRTMLDTYTLWGHKPLRDATKEDINLSIVNRKTQVAGSLKAIGFEQAVLRILPANKTCGQALTSAQIDKLWMKHYGR